MEIFGGFMMMMSIIGFFLAVIWFILPFVILSMKGKLDRSFVLLEDIERRLTTLEARLREQEARPAQPSSSETSTSTEEP